MSARGSPRARGAADHNASLRRRGSAQASLSAVRAVTDARAIPCSLTSMRAQRDGCSG